MFMSPGLHGGLQPVHSLPVGGTTLQDVTNPGDSWKFPSPSSREANNEGFVWNKKAKGTLSSSGHEIMEFKVFTAARRANSKLMTQHFRRADFVLFRVYFVESHGARPWRKESWFIFRDHLLQAQEQCLPANRNSGKNPGGMQG